MNNATKQTLSPRGITECYGIPEGTLANMRWQKQGPKYYRVGRRILYKVADVEAWLFSHPVLTIDSLKE
jgi:hypothetical protein